LNACHKLATLKTREGALASDEDVESWLAARPTNQHGGLRELRTILADRLPIGFEEVVHGAMLAYVVPRSLYPAGYHANRDLPLPFISLAGQRSGISLYHFGLYGTPEVDAWFRAEYPNHSATKLDMGKSCIRFKKPDQIPLTLIGQLATKITPQQWITTYEATIR
jgi:hypothetical protein